tara:strand:+ start:452 stop:634 length:183 start_codon:yes stop_codon:yes gene_type:complete
MKVTNEQLMSKMNSIISKVENIDDRLIKVEEIMNKSKGAVSVIVWLAGISVIVGGYFYQK